MVTKTAVASNKNNYTGVVAAAQAASTPTTPSTARTITSTPGYPKGYVPTGNPAVDAQAQKEGAFQASQAQAAKTLAAAQDYARTNSQRTYNQQERQAEMAQQKGGRYVGADGNLYQQNGPAGKNYAINLEEKLNFSDAVGGTRTSTTKQGGLTTTRVTNYGSSSRSQNIPAEFRGSKEGVQVISPLNAQGGRDLGIQFNENLGILSDTQTPYQWQGSQSNFDYGKEGFVTYKQKQIIPREERQKIKDYIKSSDKKVFALYDAQGKFIKITGRRNAYPDILKNSLAGGSYGPANGPVNNFTYVPLNPAADINGLSGFSKGEYGPPKSPVIQKQGPVGFVRPDVNKISGGEFQSTLALENIVTSGHNLISPNQREITPTPIDKFLDATSQTVIPLARDLINKIIPNNGIVKSSTPTEKAGVFTAFPNYITATKREIEQHPVRYGSQLTGEIGLYAIPYGGQALWGIKMAERTVSIALKIMEKIGVPKIIVKAGFTEKIPVGVSKGNLVSNYHGTSVSSAMSILKQGFKTNIKEPRGNTPGGFTDDIFATSDKKIAQTYANYRGTSEGLVSKEPSVILKITGKESAWYKTTGGSKAFQKQFGSVSTIPPNKIESITVVKGPKYLKGQTYYPKGISLGEGIAGKAVVTPAIKIELTGYPNIVKISTHSEKQINDVFLNVKTKKFGTYTNLVGTPKSFEVKGPLSHISGQAAAQQKKFSLTQTAKNFFESAKNPTMTAKQKAYLEKKGLTQHFPNTENLANAIKNPNAVVAGTGRFRTFSVEQVTNDKELARQLFGNQGLTRRGKIDVGMIETIGVRTGGTKIPKGNLSSRISGVFNPFKKSTVNLESKTTGAGNYVISKFEKFSKKLPTSSYVTDVQKHTRFIDPFSNIKNTKWKKPSIPFSFAKGEGKGIGGSTGKAKGLSIVQISKPLEKAAPQQKKKDMDILFQNPRFTGENYITGGGLITAETSTERYPKDVFGNRMVESPNKNVFVNEQNNKLRVTPENKIRSFTKINTGQSNKLLPGVYQAVSPKSIVTQIPIQTPKIRQITIPKTIPTQTPIITQITTPVYGQITIPKTPQKTELIQIPIFPTPTRPKLEEPLIPPTEGIFFGPPLGSGRGGGYEKPQGPKFNWVGNVPQDQVEGIFGKQSEITYGRLNTKRVKGITGVRAAQPRIPGQKGKLRMVEKLSRRKSKGPIKYQGFSNPKSFFNARKQEQTSTTGSKGVSVFKRKNTVWGSAKKYRF